MCVLSIFIYIQITTVSTVCFDVSTINVSTFLGSTWFVCFVVAFGFAFALSVFCRLLPFYTASRGLPHRTFNPRAKARQLLCGGGHPLRPTRAQPSIDLSLWCHTGTHNNEGPQTFWRYPACSCCFSRNQHAVHLVRAMSPIALPPPSACGQHICIFIRCSSASTIHIYLPAYKKTVNRVDTEPGLAWPSYQARRTSGHVLHDLAYWWRVQSVPKCSE